MYRFTAKRREQAYSDLAIAKVQLETWGSCRPRELESKLRELWGVGYQELKDIMLDMFRNDKQFRYVAADYMQHSSTPGPVEEFKPTLDELYRSSPTYEAGADNAKLFWDRFKSEKARTLRSEITGTQQKIEKRQGSADPDAYDTYDEIDEELASLKTQLRELTGEEY